MLTNDPKILELIKSIEAKKRIKISNYRKEKSLSFIDPYHYEDLVDEKSFHVITGRRGSGKTTLMIKSISNEIDKRNLVVVIDSQIYRENSCDSFLNTIIGAMLDKQYEVFSDIVYMTKYLKGANSLPGRSAKFTYLKKGPILLGSYTQ